MAAAVAQQPVSISRGGIGGYKDFAPTSFLEKNELEGTAEAPPASYPNYLPTWDKEKK